MATLYTSALSTPTMSTTGTRERTVSDTIRHLFPGNDFLCLVESGLPNMKEVKQKRGLITKRKVDNTLFECFTYTPIAVEYTIATFSSVASFTLDSADGLRPKMCLLNTRNMTVCRIGTVDTSTETITATTIGATTFTASVDDVLLCLGPAYGENSSSPYMLMKDEDNLYNCTQIFRFPGAISNTAGGNPHYGGSYWGRVRERVVVEGLRRVTHSMFFSERASSGETTTDSILSDTPRTMRGLWNWGVANGATFDCGGNMTYEKFLSEMPLQMNDTVGSNRRLVMAHGMKIKADIMQWEADKLGSLQPGNYEFFGVKTNKLVMARGEVDLLPLDVFDRGALDKCAVIFSPDEFEYVYKNKGPGDKNDRDFHMKLGIQNNDVDGVEDEILGEISLGVKDGGSTTTLLTNWLS